MPNLKSPRTSPWRIAAKTFAAGAVAVAAVAAGCSGDESLKGLDPGAIPTPDAAGSGPCEDGASRACGVTVGQQGDVLTCFEGTQTCAGGVWGECTDGELVERRWDPGQVSPEALSPPSPCVNNPCDPFCQNFNEIPDGGIRTTEASAPPYNWQQGGLGTMPPGLVSKGLKEPCIDGADCQFNHFCSEPVTNAACGHSKCQTGTSLVASCDRCVQRICAADPSCCSMGPAFCPHSACEQGPPLDVGCSACTAAVCAAQSSCCTDSWDASCASIARTISSCGCPSAYACNGPGERISPAGKCYYRQTSPNRSWLNAQADCRARGALWDLATVNNLTENNYLETQLANPTWIGFNDRATEGTFVWSNGQTPGFTRWALLQPNDGGFFGASQDCVLMDDANGRWNDVLCTDTEDFMCEYEGSVGLTGYCTGAGEALGPGGNCYFIETSGAGWTTAQTACRGRGTGWDLATVDDATEQAFLEGAMTASSDHWIGLNDRTTEGTYVWSNGGTSTYRNWESGQPNNSGNQDCVEIDDGNGRWNDDDCGDNNPYICEHTNAGRPPPPNNWTAACVARVGTLCDAKCDTTSTPPKETGQCFPWTPGQTDPACPGVDLAIGVPCSGPPTVLPICNHGNTTAPAGIQVVHFAANSNQYPSCTPNLGHSSARTCTTTQPIPPGECINLSGCLENAGNGMGNIGNREIMVNPAGAGQVTECSCLDNWSLYSPNTPCQAPSCAGTSSAATLKPVNMYIVLDRSGSMLGTRWNGAVSALTAFFQDPASANTRVALEFFGLGTTSPGLGCGAGGCETSRCGVPYTPLAPLTAVSAPGDVQEAALVAALNANAPGGSTPTYPALKGALDWFSSLANPNEVHVVILVTDGNPTACLQGDANATNAALATEAGAAFSGSGVFTYTIGMTGANIAALNGIAASGGTGSAFVIGNGTAAQIAADLLVALRAIAGQAVSCSFPLPAASTFNPASASVIFTNSAGTSTTLTQRASAGTCGAGGWYYLPNATTPSSIELCPTTCSIVQADPAAQITVALGCQTSLGTQIFNHQYQATCGQGKQPQWTFLTWDATTPGDSAISFRVKSAATQAGLATAMFAPLGVARAMPNTQLCTLTGPAPTCPANVYQALGGKPLAHHGNVELEITVNPTSNGQTSPVLNSWKVGYTCVDAF